MTSLILRQDLEPWGCQLCKVLVYGGRCLNGMFYCHGCAPGIEDKLESLVEDYSDREVLVQVEENSEVKSEEK